MLKTKLTPHMALVAMRLVDLGLSIVLLMLAATATLAGTALTALGVSLVVRPARR